MSALADEIRKRLRAYLDGELSPDDFEVWFVRATWNLNDEEDPEASDVAWELVLRRAEHGAGQWTDSELDSMLERIAAGQVAVPGEVPLSHTPRRTTA